MKRSPIKRRKAVPSQERIDDLKAGPWMATRWGRKTLARWERERLRADENQEELEAFRSAVRARARLMCEVQTDGCWGEGSEAHHKQPRSRGGTHDPENGLWTCHACHQYIHQNPRESREMGWTE